VETLRARGGRHREAVLVGPPNSAGLVPVVKRSNYGEDAMTVEWMEPRVIQRTGRVAWDDVPGTSVHLRRSGDGIEIIMMNSNGRLSSARSVPEAARLLGCSQPQFVTSTRIVAQSSRTNPQFQARLASVPIGHRMSGDEVRELMGRSVSVFFAGFGARIVSGTVIDAPGGRSMRFELAYGN
jgi:hypothetical protein